MLRRLMTRAFPQDGTLLRGIPFSILAAVTILWVTAATGLWESGREWNEYTDLPDANPLTEFLLLTLIFADLVNAVLGFALQLHQRWARTTLITLSLFRSVVSLIAAAAGEASPYVPIAINLTLIVLMLFPSAAHWCEK